jgi:hypothetical protein
MAEMKNTWTVLFRKCNGRGELRYRPKDNIKISLEGIGWWGVVWWGVVWCGVVGCGVVGCGVVWCGVVWCGVVW